MHYGQLLLSKIVEFFPGLSNLTCLSLKRNSGITAEGMKTFTNFVNLENLDLERCSKIHGGLIYLKGPYLTYFS